MQNAKIEPVNGPKELISTTEISRMCRVPFPVLFKAMLAHDFKPDGIKRHPNGGYTPLYDAALVEPFCIKAFGSFPAPLPAWIKPGEPTIY